jgi:hypothetical protein
MVGKLSPKAQQRMATLRTVADKVQHVHGLVERYAVTKSDTHADMLALTMKRAFNRLKLDLLGAGLESMSQMAASMELAAGRGTRRQRIRVLREGVGSLRHQLDTEQRKVETEDRLAQHRAEAEGSDAGDGSDPDPAG